MKRWHCELCGRKLKKPETDSRALVMCGKCLKENSLKEILQNDRWPK